MRRSFALGVLAATFAIASCQPPASRTDRPSSSASPTPPPIREELSNAVQTIRLSDNWYFGRGDIGKLQARMESSQPDQRRVLWRRLSDIYLRLGDTEDALNAIERAVKLSPPQYLPILRGERGVVEMRQGELRNCVLGHNEQSCIFPLEAGGVHVDKRPAQKAFDDLLFALRQGDPKDSDTYLSRRWLLNIVAMQLGRYPEAVPAEFRLHPETYGHPDPKLRFVDVAMGVGITDRSLVGGTVVEDMNGDGLLDILMSSTELDEPLRLYQNMGDGHFEARMEKAGLSDQVHAFNVRVADYDLDGDFDILLVRGAFNRKLGEVRRSLLRNNGDGTFSDVSRAAGLDHPAHPTGTAAWADFDGDGYPDLMVGNESFVDPQGKSSDPHRCQLFHNNGDGTFTDIAARAGVDAQIYVKGVSVGDYDNDGHPDIFLSNFSQKAIPVEKRGHNMLYHNRGDGTFEEVSVAMGVDQPARAFGTFFFDYDNDGWLDLFVACYQTELVKEVGHYMGLPQPLGSTAVFHNEKGKRFTNVSRAMGLSGNYAIMGCGFGDIDNDGWLDLYFGTGSVQFDYLVPNRMFRNVEGKRFEEVTFQRGVGHLQKGHGVAFADLDEDGDQDLFVKLGGNFAGDPFSSALFENPGAEKNHFLKVRLKSPRSLGARLRLELKGGRALHRAVGYTSSFGYTPYRQEFGLGKAMAQRLTVVWPSGKTQVFDDIPSDTTVEITEGQPELRDVAVKPFALKHSHREPGEWCLK